MKNERDALTRVVIAARSANQMAETIAKLVPGNNGENLGDHISGMLADALFLFSGESEKNDFRFSRTYALLFASSLSNEKVADELIKMAEENNLKQPAPVLMTEKEFDALYGTPEGEWS